VRKKLGVRSKERTNRRLREKWKVAIRKIPEKAETPEEVER